MRGSPALCPTPPSPSASVTIPSPSTSLAPPYRLPHSTHLSSPNTPHLPFLDPASVCSYLPRLPLPTRPSTPFSTQLPAFPDFLSAGGCPPFPCRWMRRLQCIPSDGSGTPIRPHALNEPAGCSKFHPNSWHWEQGAGMGLLLGSSLEVGQRPGHWGVYSGGAESH